MVIEPVRLEHEGWTALCKGRDEAVAFYGDVLADHVTMLFPGGLRLRGKQQVLDAIEPEWTDYSIRDLEVAETGDTAVLSYFAEAQRREGDRYQALISSVYVWTDDAWRIVLHQQTPS